MAESSRDPALLALGYRLQGDDYYGDGEYGDANASYITALRHASQIKDETERERENAKILRGRATLLGSQEHRGESEELFAEAAAKFENLGDQLHLGLTWMYAGEAKLKWGDVTYAEEELRKAVGVFCDKMGNAYYGASTNVLLADACLRQGKLSEAELSAREALRLASSATYLGRPLCKARQMLGTVLLTKEDKQSHDEGVECWALAFAIVEEEDSISILSNQCFENQLQALISDGRENLANLLFDTVYEVHYQMFLTDT